MINNLEEKIYCVEACVATGVRKIVCSGKFINAVTAIKCAREYDSNNGNDYSHYYAYNESNTDDTLWERDAYKIDRIHIVVPQQEYWIEQEVFDELVKIANDCQIDFGPDMSKVIAAFINFGSFAYVRAQMIIRNREEPQEMIS